MALISSRCGSLLQLQLVKVSGCYSLSTSSVSHKSNKNENLILLQTKNQVTTVTMNNPKKLNGWTSSMMGRLREAMDQVAEDKETKVAILTG